ncbi:TPA: hypothetical protein ACH3X1_009351 [Trebouxia sp. C0004]
MDIALPSEVKRQLKTFQVCCSCFASSCVAILAAAFSQARMQHSCYGVVGNVGGARGKLSSLPIGGKPSTGDDSAFTSRECVLLTPSFTYGDLLQASPFERAELHLAVAQAIQTLFCLYLRAHGTSPEEHAFAKEEERISRFKRKVSKVNSEALLQKSKRATEVNIQAANRFITAAIPELSKEQKQALKQAGAKRKGAPAEPAEVTQCPDKDQALTFLEQTMQEITSEAI